MVLSCRHPLKGVAIASLGVLAACSTYVNGNGVYHEESRQVDPFVGVAVSLGIQAEVRVGEERSVRISGDANLVQHIETRVQGGILVTTTSLEGFDPSLPLRLDVTVPFLESAAAAGASHVDVSGAAVPVRFDVQASERSEIRLSGTGGPELAASMGGGSHLEASGFAVQGASVQMRDRSSAELRIQAPGVVEGDLRGGSTLRVYGGGTCAVNLDAESTCSP